MLVKEILEDHLSVMMVGKLLSLVLQVGDMDVLWLNILEFIPELPLP